MRRKSGLRLYSEFVVHLMFIWPFKLIVCIFKFIIWVIKKLIHRKDYAYCDEYEDDDNDEWDDDEDNEQQIQDELDKYSNLPELPEMCQIFTISDETNIGVQFVSMCPDETAHIRVIGDTTFSQLYKRRVYSDREGRYFKLNNVKYYLDDRCTQPVDPEQAKKGK